MRPVLLSLGTVVPVIVPRHQSARTCRRPPPAAPPMVVFGRLHDQKTKNLKKAHPGEEDHYATLGLASDDATPAEIEKAHKKCALKLHPDKNLHRQEEAAAEFAHMKHAYAVLSDDAKRAAYNLDRQSYKESHMTPAELEVQEQIYKVEKAKLEEKAAAEAETERVTARDRELASVKAAQAEQSSSKRSRWEEQEEEKKRAKAAKEAEAEAQRRKKQKRREKAAAAAAVAAAAAPAAPVEASAASAAAAPAEAAAADSAA